MREPLPEDGRQNSDKEEIIGVTNNETNIN